MRLVLAVTLLALLAACGGGGGPKYADAQSVATAAGYTNCSADTVVMSSDAVDCDQGRVNWFKSAEEQHSWDQIAAAAGSFGGGPILDGDRWAIECTNVAACNTAKSKLGGKVS